MDKGRAPVRNPPQDRKQQGTERGAVEGCAREREEDGVESRASRAGPTPRASPRARRPAHHERHGVDDVLGRRVVAGHALLEQPHGGGGDGWLPR